MNFFDCNRHRIFNNNDDHWCVSIFLPTNKNDCLNDIRSRTWYDVFVRATKTNEEFDAGDLATFRRAWNDWSKQHYSTEHDSKRPLYFTQEQFDNLNITHSTKQGFTLV